jgi:hypothetical protein
MVHCPVIVNQTNETIVVFLERGILYNKAVLHAGEAVSMTRRQTGGILVPYYIHAAIGNEKALPSRSQSTKNLISVAAIPTAFIVGALCAAMSAGTLAGPSAALAPLVSGLVVNGVVVDAAAIAAGGVLASRAAVVTELILKKHPEKFMAKSTWLFPGQRYVSITGGLEESLKIETISRRQFRKLKIKSFKEPTDTVHDQIRYYIPNLPGNKADKQKQQQKQQQQQLENPTNSDPALIIMPTATAIAY